MENGKITQSDFTKLRECFISHAEIEYLYDPMGKDTGFIDPNALSAGGFPFVFRAILENISLDTDISIEGKEEIRKGLTKAFGRLEKEKVVELSAVVESILKKMGLISLDIIKIFTEKMAEKAEALQSLYSKDFFVRLKNFFATEYSIAWIHAPFWRIYRINKIKKFLESVESKVNIGFFTAKVLGSVKEYLDTLIETINDISGPIYTTYDVGWEADFSYYLALKKETENIKVRVLSDLHANTNLFAEIPLKAILAPYGKKQYLEVYKLLLHSENAIKTAKGFTLENDKCKIEIKENGEKTIQLSNNVGIDISDIVLTGPESETKSFKQYAYLWERFTKEHVALDNESHRKMYLSSLLNAKSAFFALLEECSQLYGIIPKYPKTAVIAINQNMTNAGFSETVTLKDGGWCSTGGKHVHRISSLDLSQKMEEYAYEGYVVQNYTPSVLCVSEEGVPFHGHIRKASIINRQGNMVHAGYVIKLTEQEKGNSSGYRSHMQYYSESGDFVFGKEIGTQERVYLTLQDGGFKETYITKIVLEESKAEWLKAMYVMNKFVAEENIVNFSQQLIREGKLSEKYNIN